MISEEFTLSSHFAIPFYLSQRSKRKSINIKVLLEHDPVFPVTFPSLSVIITHKRKMIKRNSSKLPLALC